MSDKRSSVKELRPRRGDARWGVGKLVCMAYADGYVMARRPGSTPFVLALEIWNILPRQEPDIGGMQATAIIMDDDRS